METPQNKRGGKLWFGTELAATVLPPHVPRPALLKVTDWATDEYAYRAELTTYVTTPTCSNTPDLPRRAEAPTPWWSQLRGALDAVMATPVPTRREPVISQAYVNRAIPAFLGARHIDTTVRRWTLAHGDLQWANLTAPELTILDWEGFGPAPFGFDAANLHAYALPVPDVARQVRCTFSDILGTPDGWLAELVVGASVLQAADRDPVHARLAPLVRDHTQKLLAVSDLGIPNEDS
ncbi:phosphotransferase [Actinomadura vinacea]